MKDEKWVMFKNYMHNELGITKEDIRQWIEDAVEQQAEKMVKHEFSDFDVNKVVQNIICDDQYFGNKTLKRDISNEIAKLIMNNVNFENIKDNKQII